jgi:hypothetical protein
MTGFLETLVARGAGLPAPGGPVPLMPRPMARFEPGGSGWGVGGEAGQGLEPPAAAMEPSPAEPRRAGSAAVPGSTRAARREAPGERAFRAPAPPADEPRPSASRAREAARAAARPETPADVAAPGTAEARARDEKASDEAPPPLHADEIRVVARDDAVPEQQPSGALTQPEAPSSAPAPPGTTADARAAAPAPAELRPALPPAAPSLEDEAPRPVSISIGRVTVEVVEPARPAPQPALQRPPGPQRTRGFDAYARARRGHLR